MVIDVTMHMVVAIHDIVHAAIEIVLYNLLSLRPSVMKYISPDLHALLWCEIEFPVSHVEEPVPVVEECHDDIDAVLGD